MSEIILKAQNIHKAFFHPIKTQILRGLNLIVSKGETVAIMGRSGEGKSTLLHILGTLETPCKGSLEIAHHDAAHFSKTTIRNKHIGFVFQSFHLLEDYSVLDNVLMPSRIARNSVQRGSAAHTKAVHFLHLVGLSDRIHHNAKLLSGGEKQRATIARALCNDPDIILADEPSGNLDSQNAAIIHELLLSFAKNNNKALIVVTHDQELAALCDTQYRLKSGILCSSCGAS